jgi:hypothetical protein
MLGARGKNKDSCQGNSGGPLILGLCDMLGGGYMLQVGMVTWGIGCADPSFPGVYAPVSQAEEWIMCEVCKEDKEYAKDAGFIALMLKRNVLAVGVAAVVRVMLMIAAMLKAVAKAAIMTMMILVVMVQMILEAVIMGQITKTFLVSLML